MSKLKKAYILIDIAFIVLMFLALDGNPSTLEVAIGVVFIYLNGVFTGQTR